MVYSCSNWNASFSRDDVLSVAWGVLNDKVCNEREKQMLFNNSKRNAFGKLILSTSHYTPVLILYWPSKKLDLDIMWYLFLYWAYQVNLTNNIKQCLFFSSLSLLAVMATATELHARAGCKECKSIYWLQTCLCKQWAFFFLFFFLREHWQSTLAVLISRIIYQWKVLKQTNKQHVEHTHTQK